MPFLMFADYMGYAWKQHCEEIKIRIYLDQKTRTKMSLSHGAIVPISFYNKAHWCIICIAIICFLLKLQRGYSGDKLWLSRQAYLKINNNEIFFIQEHGILYFRFKKAKLKATLAHNFSSLYLTWIQSGYKGRATDCRPTVLGSNSFWVSLWLG